MQCWKFQPSLATEKPKVRACKSTSLHYKYFCEFTQGNIDPKTCELFGCSQRCCKFRTKLYSEIESSNVKNPFFVCFCSMSHILNTGQIKYMLYFY